ncbi:hypothetical protein DFR50_12749 [Roseiarcus fermentans]|uniref:Uncharacterized protein n=1 Tax=Roseiarcus fermentans TaxID=1473586 RepID=A0A366EYH1_9HYPH|nr:hypothetical protein [Roseiarcus fermentans]RBP07404.1 hypothetical protein DFR50_12749 [Roseiarcus fermentans]
MLRILALSFAFIAAQGAAVADEDAKQESVQVHGKSLTLSCAEWKRNADGSWENVGPLLVGTDTVNTVTLRGAKETKVLEEKCQTASGPPAAPSRSDDSARHAKHKYRPAAAEGT